MHEKLWRAGIFRPDPRVQVGSWLEVAVGGVAEGMGGVAEGMGGVAEGMAEGVSNAFGGGGKEVSVIGKSSLIIRGSINAEILPP
jgi:hypothetical protein